jgi:hypothetical protein
MHSADHFIALKLKGLHRVIQRVVFVCEQWWAYGSFSVFPWVFHPPHHMSRDKFPKRYSARRASIGFTEAARRAGR